MPAIPAKYIGPLSRFEQRNVYNSAFKWLVIISGPEPQRSLFEEKIFEAAAKTNDRFLVVRGLPGETTINNYPSNCKVFNNFPHRKFQLTSSSACKE